MYSGTYFENINITKRLILKGVNTGGGEPVVDARGLNNAITINEDGVDLEGFRAVNASHAQKNQQAGIKVFSRNSTIFGNIVKGNVYGIYIVRGTNDTVLDNDVSSNNFGIVLENSSINNITGNNVLNNSIGIFLSASSNNILARNNATNNSIGISFEKANKNIVHFNTVLGNENGIILKFSNYNLISSNNASQHINYDIALMSSNNNVIAKNICKIAIKTIIAYDKESYNNRFEANSAKEIRLQEVCLGSCAEPPSKVMSQPSQATSFDEGAQIMENHFDLVVLHLTMPLRPHRKS